ncbi:MAG: DHH family phosphoesterase [Candidatus Micrarchaeia archaeon]
MNLLTFLKSLRKKKVVLLMHSLADVDAVAAALALKRFLGDGARAVASDTLTSPARHLLTTLGLAVDELPPEYDAVIAVDANAKSMLAQKFRSAVFTAVIDHHSRHKDSVRARRWFCDNSFNATCELIYHALRKQRLDRQTSTLLLAGILADSAGFKSASARTLKYAGELLERSGLAYPQALAMLDVPADLSQRLAMLKAAQRAKIERLGEQGDVLAVTSVVGAFEAGAATALVELGADFAFVGCEAEGGGRISARQKSAHRVEVNLAEVMAEVGREFGGSGGGHANAAGANGIEKGKLEAALARCVEIVKKKIGGVRTHSI